MGRGDGPGEAWHGQEAVQGTVDAFDADLVACLGKRPSICFAFVAERVPAGGDHERAWLIREVRCIERRDSPIVVMLTRIQLDETLDVDGPREPTILMLAHGVELGRLRVVVTLCHGVEQDLRPGQR